MGCLYTKGPNWRLTQPWYRRSPVPGNHASEEGHTQERLWAMPIPKGQKKEFTRNSNEGADATSWLWHSKLGVVGARKRQSSSGCWPNVEAEPRQSKPPPRHSSPGGLPSSPMLHKRPLPRVCSSKMPGRVQLWMETRPLLSDVLDLTSTIPAPSRLPP